MGSVKVTKEDIVRFAVEYDPQLFHIDEKAGESSIFGGLIASGWHTCSLVMKMMCDSYLLDSASMGSPGMENIKWVKPVRPNDVLTGFRTTIETKSSRSKPDRGFVKTLFEVFNDSQELVMSMEGVGMFRRKNVNKK
ncbi:MAG: dehydratase [Proteobacteria bacterium]|nr:dehydratase [Pseudomonadota bacterium]